MVLVAAPWWTRPGLEARDGRLMIAGEDAEALASRHGTPLFVYDLARFAENAQRLASALEATGLETRLRFALKANPEPRILAALRAHVGIDACSPGEVARAIECGWTSAEISYTGTNLSERDLDAILPLGVHLNLDAVSQIERVGRRAPGRVIGLRINPGAGAGYHPGLAYSGERPTKFGIYEDRIGDAVTAARSHDLTIDTIHFHAGSGWLGRDGLAGFEEALARVAAIVGRLQADGHPIGEVNVGGGLGVQARADEEPVDLAAYAAAIKRHLAPLGVAIGCEPGDYIAKDTAILLAEVVTVEHRGGTTFVGLDAGWNVNCSYFIYKFLQEIVVCRAADAPRTEVVTVAGHINEAGDVFAEDYEMAPVREGDIVALLNAGGYHQAMSSTHCLRPVAEALYLER
ncbi:MAG TPA: diaminopimelate decarboxylase [Candidatus Limnocylindrales bacterium]|nr:diaminopimelate decarboxylase [Candidatus Limnocylindrales bacterium]